MIRLPRLSSLVAAAATLAAFTAPASAQTAAWPSRPIELVVPFGVGGGTDVLARVFAEAARKHLPQPVTVMNRPGASGAIGLGEVAKWGAQITRDSNYFEALVTQLNLKVE